MASPASIRSPPPAPTITVIKPELADRAERQDQLQVVFAHRAPAGQQHGQHAEDHYVGRHGGESAKPGLIRAMR